MEKKTKIALLASGSGSNAESICSYFKAHSSIEVLGLFYNRKNSGAPERVKKHGIASYYFQKDEWKTGEMPLKKLKELQVDAIVLAGFLLKIPDTLLEAFPNKIINIHPSLLPKFGGKGMYGSYVHQAVIEAKEQESGITIHLVNEKFDDGEKLFQASIPVLEDYSPERLAEKINEIELIHYPRVIENWLNNGN